MASLIARDEIIMPLIATRAILIDGSELRLTTVCRAALTAVTPPLTDGAVCGIPPQCKKKIVTGGTNIHIKDAHLVCVCRQRVSKEKALVLVGGGWGVVVFVETDRCDLACCSER